MERIFLSYRRSDSGSFATEIAPRLAAELDAELFVDLDSILPGKRLGGEDIDGLAGS